MWVLDQEFWQPGWRATPAAAWRARVADLVNGDRWIIEGNYSGTLDIRLPRADCALWFDYPRWIAFPRIAKRIITSYGQVRPDMAPGCPEQIDRGFLRWVWDFPAQSRPLIVAALAKHGQHLTPHIFRRDRDWARWLDRLAEHRAEH